VAHAAGAAAAPAAGLFTVHASGGRKMIAAGRRPKYLLSDRVYKLIEDRELYGFRRR